MADYLVILFEGRVSVQVRKMQIMERKAPDLIGEAALKSREYRSADVLATTPVKVLLLHRKDYENALKDYQADVIF